METTSAKKRISLKGGDIYLTRNPMAAYQVEEGIILVYLLPVLGNGEPGRRLLIYEAAVGEWIPSFYEENEEGSFVFGLTALDSAVVSEHPGSMKDELGNEFAQRTGIYNISGEGYRDLFLEAYDRNSIKEEGYIFSSEEEKKETRHKGLQIIYNLFDKESLKQLTPESGNATYDAMAYICDRKNIAIAPYDKVVASAGRRFRLEDVARVSNFICREVILDYGWYKKDCGPLVGFWEDGHKAVALMPNRSGKYILYDPAKGTRTAMNEKYAQLLAPKAYMLYAPFPNKKLDIWDMFRFGLRESEMGDWLRFLILMLLGTVIGIFLPMLNEQIYDKYIPMGSAGGIAQICMVLLACNVGNLSFTIVKNLSALRGVSKMKNAVLAAACERLFNLPESFFRKYKSAELSDRIMQIDSIFSLLSSVAVKTFVSALFSILYLVQMNRYSPELMKFSVVMVLVVMIFIIILALVQMKYEKQLLEYSSEAGSRMFQYLSGIQKIRLAGVEDRVLLEYLKPYTKAREITMRKERMTNVVGVVTTCASSIFSVLLYKKMIENMMVLSIGQFCAFMSAFGAFSAAMMEVGTALLKLNGIGPMLERLKPILETKPEYEEEAELPGDLTGEIEIANVDFAYDKDGEMVLKDLSLKIKAGEYIGIVGSSGCGKSTLLKLLLGFEKPVNGKIFYDSKDIDGMDKRELRKKFGVVLQDGKMISGSIYDNIVISSPGATLQDANKVAAQVGLADDIDKMPMGMHTVVSEMGGTISGGQQQRILIARAIIGKPKVLFFDEATSALDNVTQAMVCESLNQLKATRLVIAHRLSTVMDCDRIIVMDQGRIAEEGDFKTLMEKKGLFYELASRQMA